MRNTWRHISSSRTTLIISAKEIHRFVEPLERLMITTWKDAILQHCIDMGTHPTHEKLDATMHAIGQMFSNLAIAAVLHSRTANYQIMVNQDERKHIHITIVKYIVRAFDNFTNIDQYTIPLFDTITQLTNTNCDYDQLILQIAIKTIDMRHAIQHMSEVINLVKLAGRKLRKPDIRIQSMTNIIDNARYLFKTLEMQCAREKCKLSFVQIASGKIYCPEFNIRINDIIEKSSNTLIKLNSAYNVTIDKSNNWLTISCTYEDRYEYYKQLLEIIVDLCSGIREHICVPDPVLREN